MQQKIQKILTKVIEALLDNKWIFIALGIGIVLLTIVLFAVFDIVNLGQSNVLINLPFVFAIAVGVAIVGLGFGAEGLVGVDINNLANMGGKTRAYKPSGTGANTLLFVTKLDAYGKIQAKDIRFLKLKKPFGQLRKVENENKYYHVLLYDIRTRKLHEQILPDTIYLDPRKYVIPLTMPADEDYWKFVPTTWQKYAPFAIVLVLVIEWIVQITTSAPPAP